ncbi:hypothetical protein NC652_013084 [Populus alba x Populus x berolinensis]|nr:hypothetical protein NC652_013084 [Populus alba x Populus x berolinensis]
MVSKSGPRRTGLELSRCMGFQWTHNLGKIPWSSFNPREGSLKALAEIIVDRVNPRLASRRTKQLSFAGPTFSNSVLASLPMFTTQTTTILDKPWQGIYLFGKFSLKSACSCLESGNQFWNPKDKVSNRFGSWRRKLRGLEGGGSGEALKAELRVDKLGLEMAWSSDVRLLHAELDSQFFR